MTRCASVSVTFFLSSSWAIALVISGSTLDAQEAPAREPPPSRAPATEHVIAPEYSGWTDLAADAELSRRFAGAAALLEAKDWETGLAILVEMLAGDDAPLDDPDGVKSDGPPARWISEDGILLRTVSGAISHRVRRLPADGRAVWGRVVAESGRELPEIVQSASSPPAARAAVTEERGGSGDRRGVMRRSDHAALDIPEAGEARLGGFAGWVHRFAHQRELKSSQARKNPYYCYYQPQIATLDDLIFVRSHQDVLALDRESGEVRWHAVSDQPEDRQSHNSGSGFSSWRYFTDIGGWSVSLLTGDRGEQVVVVDLSGRPTRSGGTFRYVHKSELRSYDARTGEPLWTLGGENAADERLRQLSFAAPPTPVADGETVLVAPLASPSGYYVAGLTSRGRLLWLRKLYGLEVSRKDVEDGVYESGLAHGAALAARGGVCVAAPGHGIVAAATAGGEILWASRYRSSIRGRVAEPTWAPGHPVISGETVVAAPFDSDYLIALDLHTGRMVWERQFSPGYFLLLGADGERCFTLDANGRVTAWSLGDGGLAWKSGSLGAPAGRGIVTRRRIYVATSGAVAVLDSTSGARADRCAIWDSGVPAPVPGNLFLSRASLFFAAPWGVARLEDFDATLARVHEFPLREQRAVRGRLLRRRGAYAEALAELEKALRQSGGGEERRTLRAEILGLAREAAAKTRDTALIHRILADPELAFTSAERAAFLLETAAGLVEDAPDSAASLYRQLADAARPGVLSASPEGFLVNPGLYASDCLRALVHEGRVAPDPAEEERVARWVRACSVDQPDPGRAARILLGRSHVLAAAGAHAFLARWAAERGDATAARQYLLRLEADYPQLGELEEVRRTAAAWRARLGETPSGDALRPGVPRTGGPWSLHFDHQGRPGDLVMSAPGSDPLPGVLVLDQGVLRFFDLRGKLVSETPLAGFEDLDEPRSKLESTLLEPSVAFADRAAGRMVLSTPVGLLELDRLGSGTPRVLEWFRETHPLARRWDETGGADTQRQVVQYSASGVNVVSTVERFAKVPDERMFYSGVHFTRAGHPLLVETDGSVIGFEARTGRALYRADAGGGAVAGLAEGPGGALLVATVDPPQLVIHDLARGERTVLPAPAPPWKWGLVPGIAVVFDTPVGIEVRQMTPSPDEAGAEERRHHALWRDARARGRPSLVHADARQVIAVEPGGHLVSRELRSGRSRWTVAFPADFVPVRVHEVEDPSSPAGDLVIVGARQGDPWPASGVLPQRAAEDLFVARVSADGEERWTSQLAAGRVACDGRWLASGAEWHLAYNHEDASTWKTRVVRLDPASGEPRTLFEHELPAAPLYPPPRVLLTDEGIAVGNLGSWAWYSPRPVPENPEGERSADGDSSTEG